MAPCHRSCCSRSLLYPVARGTFPNCVSDNPTLRLQTHYRIRIKCDSRRSQCGSCHPAYVSHKSPEVHSSPMHRPSPEHPPGAPGHLATADTASHFFLDATSTKKPAPTPSGPGPPPPAPRGLQAQTPGHPSLLSPPTPGRFGPRWGGPPKAAVPWALAQHGAGQGSLASSTPASH